MQTITTASPHLQEGDRITISGFGYDRKGRLIRNGKIVKSGKKTKAKIIRLEVMTRGPFVRAV